VTRGTLDDIMLWAEVGSRGFVRSMEERMNGVCSWYIENRRRSLGKITLFITLLRFYHLVTVSLCLHHSVKVSEVILGVIIGGAVEGLGVTRARHWKCFGYA
jgi:hypothetical protein